MLKGILFFVVSISLTAVFSCSLKIFLKEDFVTLGLKTILIPCFTWSILILCGYTTMNRERFVEYFSLTGFVCLIGSASIVPGGLYNFFAKDPDPFVSVVNVFCCVMIMSAVFGFLLKKKDFPVFWWWLFNVLICINMAIFRYAATG